VHDRIGDDGRARNCPACRPRLRRSAAPCRGSVYVALPSAFAVARQAAKEVRSMCAQRKPKARHEARAAARAMPRPCARGVRGGYARARTHAAARREARWAQQKRARRDDELSGDGIYETAILRQHRHPERGTEAPGRGVFMRRQRHARQPCLLSTGERAMPRPPEARANILPVCKVGRVV